MARYHIDRYGRDISNAIRRALELPESDLPEKNEPKPWLRDRSLENRIERLKKIRDRVARELSIEPSVLAPRHVLTSIATTGTLEVAAMREWQKKLIGAELLKALAPVAVE